MLSGSRARHGAPSERHVWCARLNHRRSFGALRGGVSTPIQFSTITLPVPGRLEPLRSDRDEFTQVQRSDQFGEPASSVAGSAASPDRFTMNPSHSA
jgi:hypothetical protein